MKKQFVYIYLLICCVVSPQIFAQTSPNVARITATPNTKAERFPKQIQVEGVKLSLNGLGTRYKAIFKVYDMGLYTTTKVNNLQDLVNAPGPKRLHFIALRELPG
ncbi:MAG: hypothetical protein RL761_4, partial [Pseudomonadota bacterium]